MHVDVGAESVKVMNDSYNFYLQQFPLGQFRHYTPLCLHFLGARRLSACPYHHCLKLGFH